LVFFLEKKIVIFICFVDGRRRAVASFVLKSLISFS